MFTKKEEQYVEYETSLYKKASDLIFHMLAEKEINGSDLIQAVHRYVELGKEQAQIQYSLNKLSPEDKFFTRYDRLEARDEREAGQSSNR